MSSGVGLNKNV